MRRVELKGRRGGPIETLLPMSGAVMSFLVGWWVRLIGRARAQPRPLAPDAAAGSEAAVGGEGSAVEPAELVARRKRLAREALAEEATAVAAVEQSFRETVRLGAAAPTSAPVAADDPALRERTLAALADLKQIPALQSLAQGFIQTTGRVDVDVEDIVESIEKDSALCVRVLGMANSVAVASEQRVDDLATAVNLLGVVRVRRLAQALFTLRDSQRMAEGLDWRHLWIHAFATAAIAEELERRLRPGGGVAGESQIHLAGLLHDVGKIVLSTVAPEAYRDIVVAAWQGGGRLDELERARLGVSHGEAGVIFAERNRLPEIVIAAITHHAKPEAAEKPWRFEVALVSLANYLSKAHGLGFSGARLDETDGEFEQLAAWRIVAEECGREIDVATLAEEMSGFFVTLRAELKQLREGH